MKDMIKKINQLTRSDVVKILKKEQPFLKRKYGVRRLAIFGSFAKGTQSPKSDIDILVEFEKPLGLEFIQLIEYLDKKLGRKTDVLTRAGVNSIRIKKIANDIRRTMVYV